MDAEKYTQTVSLICSTCGSKDFEFDESVENGPIRCVSCDRIFRVDELQRENGAIIEAKLDEMKEQIAKDIEKDLSAKLRKGFSGSKNIKFR